MTAARQQRKERRARIAVFAIIVSLFAGLPLGAAAGGITETDGKPLPGSPDFELQYGGAVWRFCNFGNRAAFAERPDVSSSVATIRSASPAAWLWPEGRTFG